MLFRSNATTRGSYHYFHIQLLYDHSRYAHVVVRHRQFTDINYSGRKKLKQVEAEINRLSGIVHPNLLRVLAVKLSMPHTDGNNHDSGRLVVLSEERPRLSLEDVLEDSDSLREGKAKVRVHYHSWGTGIFM